MTSNCGVNTSKYQKISEKIAHSIKGGKDCPPGHVFDRQKTVAGRITFNFASANCFSIIVVLNYGSRVNRTPVTKKNKVFVFFHISEWENNTYIFGSRYISPTTLVCLLWQLWRIRAFEENVCMSPNRFFINA